MAELDQIPQQDTADEEDSMPVMTLGEHLEELRRRLFYAAAGLIAAMVLCLVFGTDILRWIEAPYAIAMKQMGKEPRLWFTGVTDPFSTYLRVSFYAGLVISSPWVFYHLWSFMAAGLYRRERRYVWMALPFSIFLFLTGAAFAVCLAIPALKFFISFGDQIGLSSIIGLDEYIRFMTNLLLAFGAVFEVPLVVLVLARVGLADMAMLRRYRRHIIVAMTALAAVLAPADLWSMMAMVLSMWLLYELGVLLAWLLVFRKEKAEENSAEREPPPGVGRS